LRREIEDLRSNDSNLGSGKNAEKNSGTDDELVDGQ